MWCHENECQALLCSTFDPDWIKCGARHSLLTRIALALRFRRARSSWCVMMLATGSQMSIARRLKESAPGSLRFRARTWSTKRADARLSRSEGGARQGAQRCGDCRRAVSTEGLEAGRSSAVSLIVGKVPVGTNLNYGATYRLLRAMTGFRVANDPNEW